MPNLWRGLAAGVMILCALAVAVGLYIVSTPRAKENVRVERPPPRPPACAAISDLDVRLGDRRLADVRVIRVRSTLLYVPSKWLLSDFVDKPANKTLRYESMELFNPDLHQTECPGVVHDLVLSGQTPRHGSERGSVVAFYLSGDFAPVVIRGTNGRMQGFGVMVEATVMPGGLEKRFPRSSSVGRYWVKPSADFFLAAPGPIHASKQARYTSELNDLGKWLMTKPAVRQNDRTFFTGPGF